ncbi:MAG: hypothetical protein MJ041_05375, partial [Acidaminococcaceae bacterium]|nr:hypothetical protein [Acidaminococcaceae bacterium]
TNADYIGVSGKNTVNAGRNLTLLGGTLNKVIGGKGNVTIGNGTDAVTMAVDPNLFTNTGDLTVADNSTLQTNVTVNRKINGGGTVELTDNVTITDRVEINRLTTNGKIITVGNDSKAGYVDAKEIQLKGGMIFLDPIWKNGVGVEGATHVATQTADLDGHYVVGRNSILTFGTTNENGDVQFKLSGLKWGQNDISAATYVAKNINVSGGSLTIDGSLTAPPTAPAKGTVNMAEVFMPRPIGVTCGLLRMPPIPMAKIN